MNNPKHFFSLIKQLSYDLRHNDELRYHNAVSLLSRVLNIRPSWKSLSHNQLLNVIAGQLGYHTQEAKTSWKLYVDTLTAYSNEIKEAYSKIESERNEWLFAEDRPGLLWYIYLRRNNPTFNDRVDLLTKYLSVREADFSRCKIKGLNCFGINFDSEDPLLDFQSEVAKGFFKHEMEWIYLFDSKILYSSLIQHNFRNAICHNVDFQNSCFSLGETNFDMMLADFSFCNISYAVFVGSYARETKFYKTIARHTCFDKMNATGTLFIDSDLENASFCDARLHNVSFRGSRLYGANFQGAHLSGVDCRGADLRNVKGLNVSSVFIDKDTLL